MRFGLHWFQVNKTYDEEKTKVWQKGSLEWMISNLVKNWEKEASHKVRGDQWRTVEPNVYRFQTNGGPWYDTKDMVRMGTYNALIEDSEFYSGEKNSFEDSHKSFRKSLKTFAWEVLEVYGGPPSVAIKWRHWGKMTGKFSCIARNGEKLETDPTGETVETFGITIAKVDDKFRILELENYWDPDPMLKQLTRKRCPVTGKWYATCRVCTCVSRENDTSMSHVRCVQCPHVSTDDNDRITLYKL